MKFAVIEQGYPIVESVNTIHKSDLVWVLEVEFKSKRQSLACHDSDGLIIDVDSFDGDTLKNCYGNPNYPIEATTQIKIDGINPEKWEFGGSNTGKYKCNLIFLNKKMVREYYDRRDEAIN